MISPKYSVLFMSVLMLNITQGSDISSSLTSFFNKMGMASNITPPALFKDQAAGYATGGGISFSGNVMDSKLAHIEMPSIIPRDGKVCREINR